MRIITLRGRHPWQYVTLTISGPEDRLSNVTNTNCICAETWCKAHSSRLMELCFRRCQTAASNFHNRPLYLSWPSRFELRDAARGFGHAIWYRVTSSWTPISQGWKSRKSKSFCPRIVRLDFAQNSLSCIGTVTKRQLYAGDCVENLKNRVWARRDLIYHTISKSLKCSISQLILTVWCLDVWIRYHNGLLSRWVVFKFSFDIGFSFWTRGGAV